MRANRREPGSVPFWFQSIKCRPHGGLLQGNIQVWKTTGKYYWPRSNPCSRRRKPATRRRKPLSWTRHGWAACRAWMPCRRRRCRKRRGGGGGKNCCRSTLPCGALRKMITVIARTAAKISRRRAWRSIPLSCYASPAPQQKNCCRRPPCGRTEGNRDRFPSGSRASISKAQRLSAVARMAASYIPALPASVGLELLQQPVLAALGLLPGTFNLVVLSTHHTFRR